ncbi:MAG: hypothetical protein Q9208_002428 [Pyrenodesmia sp. 3 TL-2023]
MSSSVQDKTLDTVFGNGELTGDAAPINPFTEEEFVGIQQPAYNNTLRRPIFEPWKISDGDGEPVTPEGEGTRTTAHQYTHWKTFCFFPASDDLSQKDLELWLKYMPKHVILPDFWVWKLHSILGDKPVSGKVRTHYRYDFSSKHTIKLSRVPCGRAAVLRYKNRYYFAVVNGGIQLHGDLGTRLGLPFKMGDTKQVNNNKLIDIGTESPFNNMIPTIDAIKGTKDGFLKKVPKIFNLTQPIQPRRGVPGTRHQDLSYPGTSRQPLSSPGTRLPMSTPTNAQETLGSQTQETLGSQTQENLGAKKSTQNPTGIKTWRQDLFPTQRNPRNPRRAVQANKSIRSTPQQQTNEEAVLHSSSSNVFQPVATPLGGSDFGSDSGEVQDLPRADPPASGAQSADKEGSIRPAAVSGSEKTPRRSQSTPGSGGDSLIRNVGYERFESQLPILTLALEKHRSQTFGNEVPSSYLSPQYSPPDFFDNMFSMIEEGNQQDTSFPRGSPDKARDSISSQAFNPRGLLEHGPKSADAAPHSATHDEPSSSNATVQERPLPQAQSSKRPRENMFAPLTHVQDRPLPQLQSPKQRGERLFTPLTHVQDSEVSRPRAAALQVAMEQGWENTDHALFDLVIGCKKYFKSTQGRWADEADARAELQSAVNSAIDAREKSFNYLTGWDDVLERVGNHGEAPGQQTEKMAKFVEDNEHPSKRVKK